MNRNEHGRLIPSLFVALVVLSVLGARITIHQLEIRLSTIRDEGTEMILREFGAAITWTSISPTIVNGISMNGVSIQGIGTVEQVQVHLQIFDVLRGRISEAIPEIVVLRPQIVLESPESQAALQRLISALDDRDSNALATRIRVRNGTFRYRDETQEAALQRIAVDILLSPETIDVSNRMEARYTRFLEGENLVLTSDISTELEGSRGDGVYSGTVDFGRISGSHLVAERQSVFVRYENDVLHMERIRSSDPIDLAAMFDVQDGSVSVHLRSAEFRPAEIVELTGPWREYQRFLAIPLTSVGTVSIRSDGVIEEASGSLSTYLNLPELPEPFSVDGDFEYANGILRIQDSRLRPSQGIARFTGQWDFADLAPSGSLYLDSFSYAASPAISGVVVVNSHEETVSAAAASLTVNTIPLYSIALELKRAGEFFDGSLSASGSEDTENEIYGRVRMGGLDDLAGELTLVGFNFGTATDLGRSLGYSLQMPAGLSQLAISGTARFDIRGDSISVDLPNFSLSDPDSDLIVRLGGRYSDGVVFLERYFVRGSGITAFGEALVVFGSGGTIDFETDLSVNRVQYSVRGLLDKDGNLVVLGPYGIEARLRRTRTGAFRLQAAIDSLPLPIGESTVSTRLDGLFLDRDDWYVGFSEIRIENLTIPGGSTGSVVLAATIEPDRISIALLETGNLLGSLAGTAEINYQIAGSPSFDLEGRFGALDGPEQYRISARYEDRRFAVDARILSSPIARISSEFREGTISGTIQAAGPLDSPQVRAYFESNNIRSSDRELEFQVFAYGDTQELRIENSDFRLNSTEISIQQVRLDRVRGAIEGTLQVDDQTRGRSEMIAIFGNTDSVPVLSMPILAALPIRAQIDTTPLDEDREPRLYRVERSSGVTSLRRSDGVIAARLEDSGSFEIVTTAPFPVIMQADGIIGRGEIELTASGVQIDLAPLLDFLVLPGFENVAGTASGSVRIIGRPEDPDIYGTLRIDGLSATTSFSPETIGPIDTAVVLEEKLIRLRSTQVEIAGTTVDLDGQVVLNRLVPSVYEFTVVLTGETGLHIARRFGPIDVDGYGLGRITVRGDQSRVAIDGAIRANNTRITVSDDFVRQERDTNLIVNLDLETGRAVQFIWPNSDFPILRANSANNQQISIASNSLTREFDLQGEVAIQSGDVYYFDRSFFLRDGTVVFRENEDQFDPRITVRAELREATPDGTVRIYLVADNQALSEFSPRFESNPPLTGNEIVAILGGNIFQQSDEAVVNLSTALLSTSDIVTQFGLLRSFEDSVREQLNLDLFAVRTSLIQNALLTAIDPTDQTVQQVSPSLGTYLNNTSIFMGRYLGDAVFGQVLVELRSKDFLENGEDRGIQELGGVLIDSEISLEWLTPFFLLEWAIAPQNPEELFVRDNTFSFLWSFRY